MRRFSVIVILLAFIACDKDEDPERYTSIEGFWVVRPPDESPDVAFRITRSDDDFAVDKAKIVVTKNGVDYNGSDGEIAILSDTEIESITLVKNDGIDPFFVIRFQKITVNDDFTEMQIELSSFNFNGSFSQPAMLRATR